MTLPRSDETLAHLGYITPAMAAYAVGRPERSIRTWQRQGALAHRWHRGRLYVCLADVRRTHATRGRRKRLPAAA